MNKRESRACQYAFLVFGILISLESKSAYSMEAFAGFFCLIAFTYLRLTEGN